MSKDNRFSDCQQHLKDIANREAQAFEDFGEIVANVTGCTVQAGIKVAEIYLKAKAAKLDRYNGKITVVPGLFLDKSTLNQTIMNHNLHLI